MKRYCQRCGNMSETEDDIAYCSHCGAQFEDTNESGDNRGDMPPSSDVIQNQSSGTAGERYTPWEDKSKLGFVGSLFETWKESVFNPTAFYRKMPRTGGIGNPLLYGLILGFIGLVFEIVYQQLFSHFFDLVQWFDPAQLGGDFDADFYDLSSKMNAITNLIYIVLAPVLITVWFFIWSGIVHLVLMIFGWKKEDFEATFRLITYSEGPSFFSIVPFLGGLVAIVWQTVLVVIGVKEVHRISTGQAILVVLLPLILCCFCCCGIFSMILGLIGMAD